MDCCPCEVCKNHVAGHQFEPQRSATANAESDDTRGHARADRDEGVRHNAPGTGGPGGNSDGVGDTRDGDSTGGRDDHSDNADRRTRRRLASGPALTGDTAASPPGSSRSDPPIAPAPTSSAAVPAAPSPARNHAATYPDGDNASVLALSGAHDGTDGSDASGMPAPSGAGPGAQ